MIKNEEINLDLLTADEKKLLRQSFLTLEKKVPAIFTGLNIAQYRAFKAMYTKDPKTGLIPAMGIVTFANGVGKTHALVLDMKGWTQGPNSLNYKAFPEEALDYWNSYEVCKLRDAGLLNLRLVCESTDMKSDGSVHSIIKSLSPEFKLADKDNGGFYKEIIVRNPNNDRITNSIGLKTFDQDEKKHSGSTCQRIWINEPLPDNLIGETIGRIRSKRGAPSGSIAMFGTLLGHSRWAGDLSDDADLRIVQVKGHIYENCVGEEVTDAMARDVKEKCGNVLEKNPDGPGYITNGVLEYHQIKAMKALWHKICPHQEDARMCGSPISEGGVIYLTYKRDIHLIPRETYAKIPSSWPVIQIVDPHSARPAFALWATITPANRAIVIREWPDVPTFGFYEKISERKNNISQECEIWTRIEAEMGVKNQIVERLGDPNRFLDPQPHNNLTLKQMYAKSGFNFLTNLNDNHITGHEKVSEGLYCDELRLAIDPNDIAALPRLMALDCCENIDRAFQNYGFKKETRDNGAVTEKLIEKFKDPMDCVRYLMVWLTTHTFQDLQVGKVHVGDFDKIKNGRNPNKNQDAQSINTKGRRLITAKGY